MGIRDTRMMARALRERWPIEESRRQHVKGVKPAASLSDVLDDEVARIVIVKPLLVLKRVVHLSEGHRTTFEPAIQYLGNSTHHGRTGRIVGVWPHEIVHLRTMQLSHLRAEVTLQISDASVDINSRIFRIVALPHGNR